MAETSPRNNRTICTPFCNKTYVDIVECPQKFRAELDDMIAKCPEIFPLEIHHGYRMKDSYVSIRLNIRIRRIKVENTNFTIRPSFVMPYQTAFTKDVDNALFLRKFDIPFWALAHVFGRNTSFWYRLESHLGRFSIVGTTVKDPDKLPVHIVADEKHTKIRGKKCYIPTIVAEGCILGVAVTEKADNADLERGYSTFKQEALDLKPEYSPKTVNTDGWAATKNAFGNLFPSICILSCFLHVYIKIRDRSKKKHRELFVKVATAFWECFQAPTRRSFSQKIRRLVEVAQHESYPDVILAPLKKLKNNIAGYSMAYKYKGSHRTSNMLDRLMQGMDRHLYNTRYFHGSFEAAEQNIRGWAHIKNFAPQNPKTVKQYAGLKSPSEQLNGRRYHDYWLQNLLISSSLGGFRGAPLNPK